MQPALSTSANSGLPAGARRADDMTPEAWTGLIGGLMEFLGEEAKEPEHAADQAEPHGAGVAFVTPRGHALFLKRSSDGDHPNEWAFPGGGLEDGESAEAAARREAREETGHPADGGLRPLDRRATGGVDFATYAHPVAERFEPKLNGEHVEHAWAPLTDPPQPLHPGVEATLAEKATGNDWMPVQGGKMSPFDSGTDPEVSLDDLAEAIDAAFNESAHRRDASGEFASSGSESGSGTSQQDREDFEGQARRLSEHAEGSGWSEQDLADYADEKPAGVDEAIDGVEVDATHDGPWMSCMSKDRRRMYRNKNVPAQAEIDGKAVPVDPILVRHEKAEVDELEKLLTEFQKSNGREPNDEERKAIYLKAHKTKGTPSEKAFVEETYGPGFWEKWSAWCRGEEAKVEKMPPTNPPEDADVKPIPHGHGDLEAEDAAWDRAINIATDWALKMALDDSVRSIDYDGRLHVEVANICEANICPYKGEEIPGWEELGLDPDKIYQLLRDPEELEKALPSANSLQILKKHVPVNADDHQPWETVGATGSTATWVAPCIQNSLVIWAQDAIDDIESEAKRSLSPGYHYRPDLTPGSYQGEAYDGVMRDIKFNHLAIVETGRQGENVVIGDTDEVLWALAERAIVEFVDAR
jgi:8-oxo-dGTP pyrophosphatase MutT (NUDIX family)